ncbi:MAG: calcium-binding protein [Cyanobacteria bacterium J06631_6]
MQEFIVSTLEDENDDDFSQGDLSLREAIAISESGYTITFDSELANGTIDLSLGQLVIDKSLTINGLGANNTVIDAGDRSGVFDINDNTDAVLDVGLNNLTITGGGGLPSGDTPLQNRGGGIFNLEDLEINNANIYNNRAFSQGGGIYSDGVLTVNNSAVYENITNSGDRSASGAGITNAGTAIINQSTVSNNDAGGRAGAGGIENVAGTLAVTNSTVNGNDVGGISNQSGEVTVTSSIVAGNANNNDVFGDEFISGGNNLIGGENPDIGSANGFTNAENGDLVGTADAPIDPQLGEVQDNGGATFTQAINSESPAVDTGSNPNQLETDQRGEGFDRTVGDGTDIGAYEIQDNDGGGGNPTELVVSTLEDENDGDFSQGDLSLREAIAISESGDTITFYSELANGTIDLSLGQLVIDKSLTINGLGASNTVIDAGARSGVFEIDDNTDAVLDVGLNNLTITGGSVAPGNNGGGIINQENLTLNNSVVSNNSTQFGSGGGISNSGELTLNSSLISGNSAGFRTGSGGGISNAGTANIINSTITGNNAFIPGGGISSSGTLNVTNSTVTNNNAGFSGDGISGSATITSSIIAGNGDSDLDGSFTSGGNNLVGNSNDVGLVDGENGDIVGTVDNPIDPLLSELQNNGGATQTVALLENSPAINAGSNPSDLVTDQRGEGFNRTIGNGTDIGAFELQTIVDANEIIGTAGGDVLEGTEEGDRILGLDGNDTIRGLGGDDTIEGDNGNDSLEGSAGNDFVNGSDGFDSLFGGAGNDTLDAGNGNDSLEGGAGNDLLIGQGDRDTLLGGDGEDTLDGGAGVDFLVGGAGNDTLLGLDGADSLFGGNGNDFIDGGLGNDSVRGDDGDDIFVLAAGNGTDFIVDFNRGNNLIGLSEGISFADLSFSGNNIILGNETLATLNGFNAANLTQSNFTNV